MRSPRTHIITGFLMIALGFLTGTAWSDSVGEALECLEAMERERAAHDDRMVEAESVGLRIDHLRRTGAGVPDELLRRAERLEQDALEREVALSSRREICRTLSRTALEQVRRRIQELEGTLASRDLSAQDAAELIRLHDARSRMEAILEGPITLIYALLPLDPSDTHESLRAKLQYYEDVHGYLGGLLDRIHVRRTHLVRERQTLVEAQRFLEEMSFLDEGGRMSPGGTIRLPGSGDIGGVDVARPAGRPGELGPASRELESLMALSPASPDESDRLLILLDQIRHLIESEVEAVSRERDRIEERLLPDTTDPR